MTEANRVVSVGNVTFSNDAPFSLIAGPCQLESREHALECAAAIKEITDRLESASFTRPHTTRPTGHLLQENGVLAWKKPCRSLRK